MCGIAGQLNFDNAPADEALLRRMCGQITHRGPDDEGFYLSGPVGLGMRRLSIIDVVGGRQPQSNEDGTIWIVFNGEIYNFQALHAELEAKGHRFATRSDTEAVVHLYEEMGERCVTRLNGMFAFALWDSRRRRLLLARDRLGKKPIVYALRENGILFASEIQALLQDPRIRRSVSLPALQHYLRLWYVPHPLTMFEGILKLPPAHMMICENGCARLERYWDVDFGAKRVQSEADWAAEALALLDDSVRIRLMSDVPLGALLSGGIDSATVVALMARQMNQPVKTFSIGFDEEAYNELPYARIAANQFHTEHHEEVVHPDAAAVLTSLVRHYGEPFGDDSCIPTYYVSRLARQHVTVALGGDGGDESFGGYPRLRRLQEFSGLNSLRGLLSSRAQSLARDPAPAGALFNRERWGGFMREAAFRLAEIRDPLQRYANQWSVWKSDGTDARSPALRQSGRAGVGLLADAWNRSAEWAPLDRLLYLEMVTYLPDDLQVKIDIASMAASLEVRAPFLDYRLVELLASMPAELKLHGGQTKVLLRRLAAGLLPKEILQRSKWGFSVPIANWLRGEMQPLLRDTLLSPQARQRSYFASNVVEQMVTAHASGARDHGRSLWLLLNFELWAQMLLDNPVNASA
ncbi:MAG: asparagine synthase (glutamine-hydrolyzing) [Chloroflexi bacterium]|nr:asparagine synthase (glutamine-hydrolyzing) [Chloroflexota bacterium]